MVALVLIHTYMYGRNLYMWKRVRINCTFIFEFSPGSELPCEEVLLVCTALTTVLIGAVVMHLSIHSMLFHAQASASVVLDKSEILFLGRCWIRYGQRTVSISRAKVLIMVSIFVRADKVVIGSMFWNFMGMFLDMFLGYLELAADEMQCSFYCDSKQMLKFWELDQISFLDEVVAGAWTM
jgi:hypothetical protein